MRFLINPGQPVPIYRQIVDQVRRLAASGQLQPGDELPSVRRVAAECSVNPMTVSKAYSQLEAEGVIRRERGLGMVVAEPADAASSLAGRLELLAPAIAAAARHARELEIPLRDALDLFKRAYQGGD
jgi:GntR family transcriptional regulator